MNRLKYFIVFLCIIHQWSLWAQKKESDKPKTISIETRAQSALFADGLREFYTDNYQAAEKNFRQVLFKNNKNSAALYMLGKIRIANKDFSGAAYYFDEAVKIDKNNSWYKVERAKNLVNLGDYDAAAKAWEEVCKLDTKNELFLYNLSDCYINLEKYQEVIKVYNRMEKVVGPNEELTQAKRNIYLYLNDLKSAVGEYDKLIKENPNNPNFYVAAGDIYMSNNVPEKAFPYYKQAILIAPLNPQANLSLGNYWLSQNNINRSFEAFFIAFQSKALAKEDKLPVLRVYVSQAFRSKNADDIQRATQLATALTEAHPEAVEGPATLGSICLFLGDYNQAKTFFTQALSIDNRQYSLWHDYFNVLEKLGNYSEVTAHAEEVYELYPTNVIMLYNIAYAFRSTGQFDQALHYITQAFPFVVDIEMQGLVYFLTAEIYEDLHNTEEANKYYKLAESKGKKRNK